MNRLLSFLFLLPILLGCKHINDPAKNEENIEVKDVEMAEINMNESVEFFKKDSLDAVKFWDQIRILLVHNDTKAIARLSLDIVSCPVYRSDWNYFTGNKKVPLFIFLHAPFRNKYVAAFSSFLNKDTPNVRVVRSSENNITSTISYSTTEQYGNYEIFRTHNFEFVTINGSLKFAGLTIEENGSSFERKLPNIDSLYFPLAHEKWDAITNPEALDTFSNIWYSQALAAFNEPILYHNHSQDEIYRFTWLRSFNNPVVIKFERHNSDYILTTKEIVDYQGYRPDEFIHNDKATFSLFQWTILEATVERSGFWNMQAKNPEPAAHDGAEWILEANVIGKYHCVERQSPQDKTFRDCCLYLLSLSRLNIPQRDIY